MLKLLKKETKQLTLCRIILKDPRSRLAPEAEVDAFWKYWWSGQGLLESYPIWRNTNVHEVVEVGERAMQNSFASVSEEVFVSSYGSSKRE